MARHRRRSKRRRRRNREKKDESKGEVDSKDVKVESEGNGKRSSK